MKWCHAQQLRRMVLLVVAIALVGNLALAAYEYFADHTAISVTGTSSPTADSRDQRFDFFCKQVIPILDRRCGNCHGHKANAYYAMEKEPSLRTHLHWITDQSGRVLNEHQQLAYERCTTQRKEGTTCFQPIDRSNPPLTSPLLREPLATRYSGSLHPEVFASLDDSDFKTLKRWVEMEIAAAPQPSAPLAEGAEQFFAEKVVPILSRKTCFGGNCHGQMAFMDLKLDPGLAALTERFTNDIHRANRKAMLGANTRLVNLGGDIEQSKQLLKNIPIEQGGIVHKGGNNFFEKGDPDYEVLRQWLELESTEMASQMDTPLDGQPQGIVFVRRPCATPERFFEDDEFLPGADVIWQRGDEEINLTAALHPDGPADIRAPSVSYDARQVAFAMRRTADEPFNIWELQLDSRAARQLTFSAEPGVHFLDPLYVPDPDDESGVDLTRVCLVMTSNRSRRWCESSPAGILGEVDEAAEQEIIDRQLTHQAGTFNGRTVTIVRGTNSGYTRTIIRHESGRLLVDEPFPQPCDSTTHYDISAVPRMAPKYDAYRMRIAPEGRERETFDNTLKQMSFAASQIRRPTMRSNGEIVFTALRTGWQDGRPLFNGTLFRTHVDGSNVHIHNGSRSGVPIFADDRELPNGLEIRIGRSANSWWGGMLMLSDHQFGPSIEPDNPSDNLDHPYQSGHPDSSLHRFVPAWISLDPDVTFQGISTGGAYRDPYPMPDGSVLVAYAKGPIDLSDRAAAPDFDIIRLTPDPSFQSADGYAPGKIKRELVARSPQSELWPRPVVVRLKEPVKKRLKLQEDIFGAPTRVRGFAGYPSATPAVLKVFDLLLLESFFEQIAPAGQHHLAEEMCPSCGELTPQIDQVTGVRIIGASPQYEGDTGPPIRSIIAEVPLAEDGSFYVELPSGVSFDMQSLNAEGMALRFPHRWLYCHPGEQHTLSIPRTLYAQTCSGCHGGFTGRPADTLRRPDVITSASRTLAQWDAENHRQLRPANYSGGEGPRIVTIDFERDVRPILESKCVACHSQQQRAANLDLSGDPAFESLRRFVEHRESLAIKSYLIEKLRGRELHAPRRLTGEKPHPAKNPLSKEEMLTFIRWIDLGASERGASMP